MLDAQGPKWATASPISKAKSTNDSLLYPGKTNHRGILKYRKIPKISPGTYIFQRPFLRGLYLEGLIYGGKFDRASLIVGSKFTIFSLFYFVFEGNFPSTSPWGTYIWRGDLTEGFLRYRFGGLIFGGAYQGFWYFARSWTREIQVFPWNPAKFPK